MSIILRSVNLAVHNLDEAAKAHEAYGKVCLALAEQLRKASDSRPHHFDTSEIARILLPVGICLVHRDVVAKAADAIHEIPGEDTDEYQLLIELEADLRAALKPQPDKTL